VAGYSLNGKYQTRLESFTTDKHCSLLVKKDSDEETKTYDIDVSSQCYIRLYFSVTDLSGEKARTFVPGKPFQPRIIFLSKAPALAGTNLAFPGSAELTGENLKVVWADFSTLR
jgi:hypothetical protein